MTSPAPTSSAPAGTPLVADEVDLEDSRSELAAASETDDGSSDGGGFVDRSDVTHGQVRRQRRHCFCVVSVLLEFFVSVSAATAINASQRVARYFVCGL